MLLSMEAASLKISSTFQAVQWGWETFQIFSRSSEKENKWDDKNADRSVAIKAGTKDDIPARIWEIATSTRKEQ